MKAEVEPAAAAARNSAARRTSAERGPSRPSPGWPRLLRLVAGSALALSLTGCVWVRLLALKHQLADFDHYVTVEDRHGLTFRFVKPVLYTQDVRYLMELEPTARSTNADQQTWFWTFEKQRSPTNADAGDFDLTFATSFENGMLTRAAVSERMLAIVPKWFLLALVRSLGHAQVDQKKRTARVTLEPPKVPEHPLTKAELVSLLGTPFSVTAANATYTCRYRYELKSSSLTAGQTMPAQAAFTFTQAADQLTRLETVYGDLHLNFSFDTPARPAP